MVLGRLLGYSTPQREHGNERRAVSTGGVRKAKDKNKTPHRRPPNTGGGQQRAVEGREERRARGRANGGAGGEEGGHSTHRHRHESQENGFVGAGNASHARGDGEEVAEEEGEERMDVEGYYEDEGGEETGGRQRGGSDAQDEDMPGRGAAGGNTVENAIVIESEDEGDQRPKYDSNTYRDVDQDGDGDFYGDEDYDGGEGDQWGQEDGVEGEEGDGYHGGEGEDGGEEVYVDEQVIGGRHGGVEGLSVEKGVVGAGGVVDQRRGRMDYGVSITHKLELKRRQEAHAQEFQRQLKAEHDGKDFRRCLGPTTVQSRHGRPISAQSVPLVHPPHQWPTRTDAPKWVPSVMVKTDSAQRQTLPKVQQRQQAAAAQTAVAVGKDRREEVDEALGLEHIPSLDEHKQRGEGVDPVARRQAEERMRMQHLREVLEEVAREEKKRREAQRAPKPLTDQQRQMVHDIWTRGHPDQTMVSDYNLDITRAHLRLLKGLEWLNDEVINFYLEMINRRSQADASLPKVHCFNTFFLPKLEEGYDKVKRWTRRIDIFSKDLVIVPVHRPMHWCLAVIDMNNKTIEYFDSLGGCYQPALDRLLRYLQQESMDKKKSEFDTSGWVLTTRKDIPRQNNSSDCGMFMCKFAEHASRRAPFIFSQQHMPLFRERFVYEIVSKSLIVD